MQTKQEFRREVETAVRQGRHRREWHGREDARVLRGGSWNNNERGNLLSSNRNHNTPTNRNNNNGFRVVLVVSSSAPWWRQNRDSKIGEAPGGDSFPARAKKPPNRPPHALRENGLARGQCWQPTGKRRGGRCGDGVARAA